MVNQVLSASKDKKGLWKNGHLVLNTGRTWWKKDHIPWNKGINWQKKTLSGKKIICVVCGGEKYFEPNQLRKRPCKFCSVKCARLAERKNNLVYSSIHSRIKTDWGKADKCFLCGSDKNIDRANISKSYLLKRDDWIPLCRKHHIAYDKGKLLMVFPLNASHNVN